jgi:hypothetical protein
VPTGLGRNLTLRRLRAVVRLLCHKRSGFTGGTRRAACGKSGRR